MTATPRSLEKKFRVALPVKSARHHKNYSDYACACFADSVWKVLGADLEMEVRGPWFNPTNTARKTVDAVVYRVFRKGY